MNVSFYNYQSDLLLDKKQVIALVKEVFFFKYPLPEPLRLFNQIHIYFVSKKEISHLHGQFFQDPSPTDCITFPIRNNRLLGEAFICPQAALEYNPLDAYLETSLYIIHTILHLLGYNDLCPEDRTAMQKEEKRILDHLMKKNLVLSNQITYI